MSRNSSFVTSYPSCGSQGKEDKKVNHHRSHSQDLKDKELRFNNIKTKISEEKDKDKRQIHNPISKRKELEIEAL